MNVLIEVYCKDTRHFQRFDFTLEGLKDIIKSDPEKFLSLINEMEVRFPNARASPNARNKSNEDIDTSFVGTI